MNFSKTISCSKAFLSIALLLLLSITVQAQENDYPVHIESASIELIEQLNSSKVNPENLSEQVRTAKVNLEEKHKDGTYDEKEYDAHMMRLLEIEESLYQAAIEKRLEDAKNSNIQKPKANDNSDLSKAKAILKKKLEAGTIDKITYMKRMRQLEEKEKEDN